MHRIKIRFLAILGGLGLVLAGVLSLAAPALAAPSCVGSGCTEGQSVVVTASITETISPASYTFNGGNAVPAGSQVGPADVGGADYVGAYGSTMPVANAAAQYLVNLSTGDAAGYTLTGQGTPFTAGSQTIPLSALTVNDVLGGTSNPWSQFTLTGSPQTVASTTAASAGGGDNWAFDNALQIPASASNGAFNATLTFIGVAN